MTEPPQPRADQAATPVAIVVAIALLTISVIGARELLIENDVISGPHWIGNLVHWLGDLTWHGAMLPAAFAAVVAGLALVVIAGKPRRRTFVRLDGEPALWLRRSDVARASTLAALEVDGVEFATTVVDRKRARVRISPSSAASDTIVEAVHSHVADVLAGLDRPLRLTVVADR